MAECFADPMAARRQDTRLREAKMSCYFAEPAAKNESSNALDSLRRFVNHG